MSHSQHSIDQDTPVPGPGGSLLLGSLKEFQADALGFMADSIKRYGDVVRFRFGYVVAYLINRPEYADEVLSKNARRYDKNTRSVAKLRATCGNSLLSSDGPSWLKHRRLMQPVFQPRNVADFAPVVDSVADQWVSEWVEKADRAEPIDLVTEMMGLTMTIAAKVFFASDIREQTRTIENALDVILQDTWRRLESPIDLSLISPHLHRRSFRQALTQIDSIVNEIIQNRIQSESKPDGSVRHDDILSRLLRAREQDTEQQLSESELRDAVVTLLLAGHETTANALVNALYLIANSPSITSRLVHEAHATDDDTATLTESRKAFAEAIRLYPSIWIIERRVVVDHLLAGHRIASGSTVILSPYLLHRHVDYWESPDLFDPDRFDLSRIQTIVRSSYLPFGAGPHRCIGEHMALLVATRVLSRIHRCVRIEIQPDQRLDLHAGITLRHTGRLMATPHRVKPTSIEFTSDIGNPLDG